MKKQKTETIRPQMIEKVRMEAVILNALDKGKLRWSELKLKTKHTVKSTRTLSTRLQELQKKGLVHRIIDDSVYPPAVSYQLSSNAIAATGNTNAIVQLIKNLEKERDENRKIMTYYNDGSAPPEKILQVYLEDFFMDFLSTLKSGFENPEMAPYIFFYDTELYLMRLSNFFEIWKKKPELIKEIGETFNDIRAERKKDSEAYFQRLAAPFSDKPLAKAMLKYYGEKLALEKEKRSAYDVLSEACKNKELLHEIEMYYGSPINIKKYESLLAENGWKTIIAK